MTVAFLATEQHFADHLAPTYLALPEDVRGAFHTLPSIAARLPFDCAPPRVPSGPTVVASYGDLRRLRRGTPAVLSEHGAGQTYLRRHPSYAGGPHRHGVGLFLCQSHRVAALNEQAWPGRRYAVVGVPRLDAAHRARHLRPRDGRTVAVGFHWDATVVPETRWAWPHYRHALPQVLTDAGWTVLGHGHPRVAHHLAKWWGSVGVEWVGRFDQVLDRADVYVVDNSSTLYEAASVGVPVVALNAPWYRRGVHHGLRFWNQVPGPMVNDPDGLAAAVEAAQGSGWSQVRERVMGRVFARRDGTAAAAAATAIVEWAADGFPVISDRERHDAMAEDRTAHDPFAPRVASGGPTRARAGQPVAARTAAADPEPTTPTLDPDVVPTDAGDVVEWIDTAEDDATSEDRARRALAAEADRAPSQRRVSVLAAITDVLGPDEVETATREDDAGAPDDDAEGDDTPEGDSGAQDDDTAGTDDTSGV